MPSRAGPAYFAVSCAPRGLIISGWLEDAARYPGFEAYWQVERKNVARKAKLTAESLEKLGDWQVVFYEMPLPGGGRDTNARAELVRGGTWIDLHLSKPGVETADEQRAALREFLKAIEVVPAAK